MDDSRDELKLFRIECRQVTEDLKREMRQQHREVIMWLGRIYESWKAQGRLASSLGRPEPAAPGPVANAADGHTVDDLR